MMLLYTHCDIREGNDTVVIQQTDVSVFTRSVTITYLLKLIIALT